MTFLEHIVQSKGCIVLARNNNSSWKTRCRWPCVTTDQKIGILMSKQNMPTTQVKKKKNDENINFSILCLKYT